VALGADLAWCGVSLSMLTLNKESLYHYCTFTEVCFFFICIVGAVIVMLGRMKKLGFPTRN